MTDLIMTFFKTFLNAILIAFLGYLVAYIVYLILRKALEKSLGKTWALFIARLGFLAVIIFAGKIILDQTGAEGLVVLVATALTGALAIGSQGLASDMVAGLILFFTKPFNVEDYVIIGEYEGTVVSISTSATALDSYDGSRIVLRNSVVLDSTIINYTTNPALRLEVNVPVPLSEDLEKALQTLYNAIDSYEPQVRSADMPPHVILHATNYGYAEFQIRFYIPSSEHFGVQRMGMFLHAIKALKAAGISTKA